MRVMAQAWGGYRLRSECASRWPFTAVSLNWSQQSGWVLEAITPACGTCASCHVCPSWLKPETTHECLEEPLLLRRLDPEVMADVQEHHW